MEKEAQVRKILVLVMLGLFMFSMVAGIAAAQQNPVSDFFIKLSGEWAEGEGFSAFNSRIILLVLIFAVLLTLSELMEFQQRTISIPLSIAIAFIFSAYIAPENLVAMFTTFDLIPFLIGTFFPLFILFFITFVAAYRGVRTLITIQLLLWYGAVIFLGSKTLLILVELFQSFEFTRNLLNLLFLGDVSLHTIPEYAWISLTVALIVSGIMAFGNGTFMNFALRKFMGMSKQEWKNNINYQAMGLDALKIIGKKESGKDKDAEKEIEK